MAKVTSFEELSDVELLDGNDLFYVIDFASKDDKNPVSKKIKYSTLLEDMNLSIGFKGIEEISVDNVNKILWIEYEKKSGEQCKISVDLSSLVNIYDTDREYLYVDGKNTITLSAERVAQQIGDNGINISYISGTQISAKDTTYGVTGQGIKLDDTILSLDFSEICSSIDLSSYSKTDTTYTAGNGIDINTSESNKISVKLSDLVNEDNHLSIINGKISVLTQDGKTYNASEDGIKLSAKTNTFYLDYSQVSSQINLSSYSKQTTTYRKFPDSWLTSFHTMNEFCESISKTNPEAGMCFHGGIKRMNPMPPGFPSTGNIEVVVEVPVSNVFSFRASSTNIKPYHWEGTGQGGIFHGWKIVLNLDEPSTSGNFSVKCNKDSSGNISLSWLNIEDYVQKSTVKNCLSSLSSIDDCDMDTIYNALEDLKSKCN